MGGARVVLDFVIRPKAERSLQVLDLPFYRLGIATLVRNACNREGLVDTRGRVSLRLVKIEAGGVLSRHDDYEHPMLFPQLRQR